MNARDRELVKQAFTENDWDTYVHITKFANLIRADEREACAKVCENEAKEHERNAYGAYDGRYDWKADGANDCADAIRARGNT